MRSCIAASSVELMSVDCFAAPFPFEWVGSTEEVVWRLPSHRMALGG